jgi:hypothetical protein
MLQVSHLYSPISVLIFTYFPKLRNSMSGVLQWEHQLRALEALEHAYQRWLDQQSFTLTDPDRQAILALAEDLPARLAGPHHDEC